MRNTQHRYNIHHTKQGGAALFMALIFLLILTILGVFGMNVSRLENLMAGNAQFQTTALNNAEYVLAQAAEDLQNIYINNQADKGITNPFVSKDTTDHYYCGDAHCDPIAEDDIEVAAPVWNFPANKVSIPDTNGDGSDTDKDGTPDDGTGFYVITDAGYGNPSFECEEISSECFATKAFITTSQIFLVTAKSSSSRGADRIVQSVYSFTPPLY